MLSVKSNKVNVLLYRTKEPLKINGGSQGTGDKGTESPRIEGRTEGGKLRTGKTVNVKTSQVGRDLGP